MQIESKTNVNENFTPNQSVSKIVFPLKVEIDPMERLLVSSFKNDPEFSMLEPQMFNDPINGKGMRILRYRKDQKVDVYWQPGVHVDPSTITIGAGIGDFEETIIEPAHFEVTERGIDVHFAFTDAQGRGVELKIQENTSNNSRMSFLAPIGDDIENPLRLFLVNMHEFDFVCRGGTEFFAKIGDRILNPESFPIPRNNKWVLFTRYSAQPVIGTLNPPMSKPFEFNMELPGEVEIDGMKISVDEDGKINKISAGEKINKAEVEFIPGFPNLLDIKDGQNENGQWKYSISGENITGGSYNLLRDGNRINIEIDVTDYWKPSNLPLSFRIFTRLVSSFRKWPTTYSWKSIIELGEKITMSGTWERNR